MLEAWGQLCPCTHAQLDSMAAPLASKALLTTYSLYFEVKSFIRVDYKEDGIKNLWTERHKVAGRIFLCASRGAPRAHTCCDAFIYTLCVDRSLRDRCAPGESLCTWV